MPTEKLKTNAEVFERAVQDMLNQSWYYELLDGMGFDYNKVITDGAGNDLTEDAFNSCLRRRIQASLPDVGSIDSVETLKPVLTTLAQRDYYADLQQGLQNPALVIQISGRPTTPDLLNKVLRKRGRQHAEHVEAETLDRLRQVRLGKRPGKNGPFACTDGGVKMFGVEMPLRHLRAGDDFVFKSDTRQRPWKYEVYGRDPWYIFAWEYAPADRNGIGIGRDHGDELLIRLGDRPYMPPTDLTDRYDEALYELAGRTFAEELCQAKGLTVEDLTYVTGGSCAGNFDGYMLRLTYPRLPKLGAVRTMAQWVSACRPLVYRNYFREFTREYVTVGMLRLGGEPLNEGQFDRILTEAAVRRVHALELKYQLPLSGARLAPSTP